MLAAGFGRGAAALAYALVGDLAGNVQKRAPTLRA